MSTKKILVLGANLYYRKVIEEIKFLGFKVYATDKNPISPGFKYADKYEIIDISDKEKTLQFAINNKIDGVMPLNEFGITTAAYVSEKASLRGISPASSILASNKVKMRQQWEKDKLPQPEFYIANNLKETCLAVKKIGLPCVCKPDNSGGAGRGISIIFSEKNKDIAWAYNLAKPFARDKRIIIEKFIDGTEMTIEAFSYKGRTEILAMSDKEKPATKYRVATSLNFPANFSKKILNKAKLLIKEAVKSLGIQNGPTHSEAIVTQKSKIYLIELGARGGGGHLFHTIIPFVSGINPVQEFAKYLVGIKPNIKPKFMRGACYRFLNPPQGKIKSINIHPNINKIKNILDYGLLVREGDKIGELKNSLTRAGFIVTQGKTRKEAIKYANIAEKLINIKIL